MAASLQLEPGDTIVFLGGLPLRQPLDVVYHKGQTRLDFVNVRTGRVQAYNVTIPEQTPRPEWLPASQYAANLMVNYHFVDLQGQLGAWVAHAPRAGSPLAPLQLDPGDMIVALDGQPFHSPVDLRQHVGVTTVEFINIRTGQRQTGTIRLPDKVLGEEP